MKRALFLLHSWLGLVAGLGLLVIGLTGSLLVFTDEIDTWLAPERVMAASDADPAVRLGLDALRDSVLAQAPDYVVSGWEISGDSAIGDKVWLIRKGETDWRLARLDPRSGLLLCPPTRSAETFTGWLLELHYSFFADHAGLLIAGLFAVLLCLLGVTGVWIYRGFWKHFFTLRWGRGSRILFSDVHKMVGISSVAFNLILGFTGAWWNLSHLIGHLGEEEGAEPAGAAPGRYEPFAAKLDHLVEKTGETLPGFQVRYVSFPAGPEDPVSFHGGFETAGPLRSPYGSSVSFDRATGAITASEDIREAGTWAQIYDSFVPLHFGTFGGWPVKVLWSLFGLAPGVLAVTGFALWRRRRRAGSAR